MLNPVSELVIWRFDLTRVPVNVVEGRGGDIIEEIGEVRGQASDVYLARPAIPYDGNFVAVAAITKQWPKTLVRGHRRPMDAYKYLGHDAIAVGVGRAAARKSKKLGSEVD
ncbi:unnamed protein product [Rhizoctonia solani]|uniref:Uncharacterized protein n=1 Tax=Rhizoctonia solani TaxID=456999 RepID=A0A8H2WAD5_9AGAM|nr:unnamed protein product [Rhizoctonia solani]